MITVATITLREVSQAGRQIGDPIHIQPGDTVDIKGHGLIVWFADNEAGEANAIRALIKAQQKKVKSALDFQLDRIKKAIG